MRPRAELIRFVAGPDGTVVPDLAGRLPGRGFWLSPSRAMIQTACARNLFAKAAKAALRVPDGLADRVERLSAQRCIDLLGLARRAGQVAVGREQVVARLGEGRAALLLQAVDAAEGGRGKLRAMARAPEVAVVEVLSARELGRALGREEAVHVALAPGRLAACLREEAVRLAALRGDNEAGRTG